MRRPAAVLALAAALAPACKVDPPATLRAYRAESPDDLVGGDVAMARVGDFVLENDRIRVAILDTKPSPGPGVFGGTLVDADLQRTDARFRNGNGMDQLAEVFPFANLLVPRPDTMAVSIVRDGSDGESAVVRVEAEGAFFLDALNVFRAELLGVFFTNVKVSLHMVTDYILEPGKPYVRMVTTVRRSEPEGDLECDEACPAGRVWEGSSGALAGAPTCECAAEEPLPLLPFTSARPIFEGLFGDADTGSEPGVVGGDFVFFGGQNDLFAPEMGFDEERPVWDNLFEGKDPFTHPLELDYMAAAGGGVSYAYFTKSADGEPDPKVLVPIITSSATAFATSAVNCAEGDGDHESCDRFSSFTWERYLAVGDGDIASVADVVHEVRGTATGTIEGVVLDQAREPLRNGRVFVLRDPDPTRTFASVHEVVAENYRARGLPGVLLAADADPGLDPVEDGDFRATVPTGTWLVVATDEGRTSTSEVLRVTIEAGETTVLAPVVPAPAKVTIRVVDGGGKLLPAKLSFVPRGADGSLAELDGTRKPWLGEGRIGAGVRHLEFTASGEGSFAVEPGSYRLYVSHGPEYGLGTVDLDLASGKDHPVQVALPHEVDTAGWISMDAHLHAEPSFDSGMKLPKRVTTAAAEGLELAVSTDHDVVTDYAPTVKALGLQDVIATAIGVELSTLEIGHFVAFPLRYDALTIPDHDAPDWTCEGGPGILEELSDHIAAGAEGVRIMCHPRDGFIGYISQLDVDPFDQTRTDYGGEKANIEAAFGGGGDVLCLECGNPIFREATCDFEAMEVFNSKRFDLMRTPTNEEVVLFSRCMEAIEDVPEGDHAALDAACVAITGGTPLAACLEGERFFDCKMRHRRAAAFEMARRILVRTPEEQLALWNHVDVYDPALDPDRCSPEEVPDEVPAEYAGLPCVSKPGVMDDWMRWLDLGLNVAITAASDSHGHLHEPGMPRTLVRSESERPQDIDADAIAQGIAARRALPTYGPVVDVAVDDAGPGDLVEVAPGGTFTLDLRVQTASWFGVDRIEVYVSGLLEEVIPLDHGPEVVLDFEGPIELPAPETDGFVTVIALGTREENLLRPVYLDIPFGELQLPKVTALAFGSLDAFSPFFPKPAVVPDFYPIFPLAMTNAILLDADGDGAWKAGAELPEFCSRPCGDGEPACPGDQVCLSPEGVCGYDITTPCTTGPPGTGAAGALVE